MNPTHIERLRTLYAMLDGIPDSRVHLRTWNRAEGSENVGSEDAMHSCGSVACILGWAAIYPPFVEQGLTMGNTPSGGAAPACGAALGFDAGAEFFGLNPAQSRALFAGGTHNDLFFGRYSLGAAPIPETWPRLTQKQIALRRIRSLLFKVGAITAERNAELAAHEGTPL